MSTRTLGEKKIGITFEPGNNDILQNANESFARNLNRIEKLRSHGEQARPAEAQRFLSLAQTAVEEAAMWTAKALNYQE